MSQEYKDTFTEIELMYLRVALILAQNNPDVHDMPKTYEAMFSLKEKVDRIYRRMVNND